MVSEACKRFRLTRVSLKIRAGSLGLGTLGVNQQFMIFQAGLRARISDRTGRPVSVSHLRTAIGPRGPRSYSTGIQLVIGRVR